MYDEPTSGYFGQTMDDCVKLMTLQQTLEKETGGRFTVVGTSVNETIRLCLMNGMAKRAEKVRSDWSVPDKRSAPLLFVSRFVLIYLAQILVCQAIRLD